MANIQIPNLPAVANLSGAELLEAVQAGSSVKVSLNQLNALFRIGPVSFPLAVDIGGTGTTTSTGTGSVVLSNNPVLVNPSFSIGSFGLGTVTAPSITFTGDLNTGIWSPGADTVAVSTGGAERMRIDAAGRIGIGTSSPSQRLDVNGSVTVSDTSAYAWGTTGSGTYLSGSNASGFISAFTGGTERMRLINNGNLGIGTTTPQQRLAVSNAGANGFEVDPTFSTGTETRINGYDRVAAAFRAIGTNAAFHYWLTSGTERMRIDANGNVGVGTSNPTFVTGGGLVVYRVGDTRIVLKNNTTGDGSTTGSGLLYSGVNLTLFNQENGFTAFTTGGTERMRIDSVGTIGIAVTPNAWSGAGGVIQSNSYALSTTPGGGNDTATFVTNGFYNGTNWIYRATSSFAARYDQWAGQHRWLISPSGTAGNPITFTQAMTLDTSGNLLIGATSSPVSTSRLYLSDGTINSFVGYKSAGVEYFGTQSNHPVAFLANNIERYRIGTAGQLGIAGANFGTAGQAFISGGPSAATSWGTLGLAGGGTGVTTAPAAAAVLMGYTETATAAGTTVLTNTSSQYQLFTGVTTQTITLPVTSTLTTGWTFHIVNASTGNLTINSSGGNLVATVIPGTTVMVTCILTSGTTAASWEYGYTDFNTLTGTGSVVMSNGATAAFALGAVGTPSITFTGDLNTGLWSPAADTIAVSTNGGERVRVHPSGGVSVGNTTDPGATNLSVTGTVTTPTVTNAGTLTVSATGANIVNVSTNSVVRQTYNTDGAQLLFQGAPTTIAAPATLTAAQIATGIIQYTGAVGNLTLPLASDLDIYYSANVNMALDFSIINTSAAVVTVAVNTGVTSIGALATAAGTSSRWRLRRTAVATWVIYRL